MKINKFFKSITPLFIVAASTVSMIGCKNKNDDVYYEWSVEQKDYKIENDILNLTVSCFQIDECNLNNIQLVIGNTIAASISTPQKLESGYVELKFLNIYPPESGLDDAYDAYIQFKIDGSSTLQKTNKFYVQIYENSPWKEFSLDLEPEEGALADMYAVTNNGIKQDTVYFFKFISLYNPESDKNVGLKFYLYSQDKEKGWINALPISCFVEGTVKFNLNDQWYEPETFCSSTGLWFYWWHSFSAKDLFQKSLRFKFKLNNHAYSLTNTWKVAIRYVEYSQ